MKQSMQLIINGEIHEFEAPLDINALLLELGIKPNNIAFEINLEIVPKSLYSQTILADGDQIEIVRFIGGGMKEY